MNFILENWPVIVVAIAAIVVVVVAAVKFVKSGSKQQLNKVREWLLYATTLAEKELGGGTGKLKLRYVYDMFVAKFPWISTFISFDRFSALVDEVLEDMNSLLSTNKAVSDYVTGDSESK